MRPPQTWLFSRSLDLAVFAGPPLVALGLAWLGSRTELAQGPLPLWAWLVVVVGVDVAHVHATWLRTYLDPQEWKAHPLRYVSVPVLAWSIGWAAHSSSGMLFWRILAYLAVFHFVRQQLGWVALYQRKEKDLSPFDRRLDRATIYAATIWPLIWWHGHLPRTFSWFVDGDFAGPISLAAAKLTLPIYITLLCAFAYRQFARWMKTGYFPIGKSVVVASTAMTWWTGIVYFNNDWAFTLLNVLPHGIPYVVLVWQRSKAGSSNAGVASRLLKAGPIVFATFLILAAYGEEWLWDLGIWHDHPGLFGWGWDLTQATQAWLVPLLALPQAAHYVLDGFIWRGGNST